MVSGALIRQSRLLALQLCIHTQMNANWPKEKRREIERKKGGKQKKEKRMQLIPPNKTDQRPLLRSLTRLRTILNYQCCFIMCIYKLLDCYRIIHCIGPRKLKFFSECFCKYENACYYLHLDVISILILEKLAKICLCSHALTLLNNKRTDGL